MPMIVDADDYSSNRRRRAAATIYDRLDANSCRLGCAVMAGLVSGGVIVFLQTITPGLEHIPLLASFWKIVLPFFFGGAAVVFLISCVVVAWQLTQLSLVYRKERVQQALLEEGLKQKREVTLLIRESRVNQDNVDAVLGDDEKIKSFKIVRRGVILEQARIQAAEKQALAAVKIAQQEMRKQIAGPADRTSRRPGAAARALFEKGPVEIRTFAELLDAGIVQEALKRGHILLGYVNGELRYGTWLDLYSCAVGGVTGSGKTTTVRFLLFQAILAGAKLLMVDPHIHEPEESLAAQFRMFTNIHLKRPCDDDPDEVALRVHWFMAEYLRRKKGGIKGPAYIFVLDEFNEIVALLPNAVRKELAELLLRVAQSGRKFGLFCMLIGQRWSEQDLGGKPYGSMIRTSLAAMLVHRFTDESQAAKLAGGRYAADCLELPQGNFFFRDTQGGMSYTVTPDTRSSDGLVIQRLLDEMAEAGVSLFPTDVVGAAAGSIVDSVASEEQLLRADEEQAQGRDVGRNMHLEVLHNGPVSGVIDTDDCAQENDADRPVEEPQAAQTGANRYRLDDEQVRLFCFIYPDLEPNKDEALRKVGANTAYRAHANELILQYNLMAKRRKSL